MCHVRRSVHPCCSCRLLHAHSQYERELREEKYEEIARLSTQVGKEVQSCVDDDSVSDLIGLRLRDGTWRSDSASQQLANLCW